MTTAEAKRSFRQWATEPVAVTRAKIIVLAWVLGLILGGLTLLAVNAIEDAAQHRADLEARDRQIAAAVARLDQLERPTNAELRRRLAFALGALTPAQARRILTRAVADLSPAQRRRLIRFLQGRAEPSGGSPPPG